MSRGATRGWRGVLALVGVAVGVVLGPGAGASSPPPRVPVLLAGASPRADYVLADEGCTALRCLVLERFDPLTGRFTRVARPPLSPVRDEPSGDLQRLAFASARLGVALVGRGTTNPVVYFTRDGALTWRRVAFGGESVLGVAAGGGALYAVLGRCRVVGSAHRCHDFRLAHATGDGAWTSVPVPASVSVDPFPTYGGPELGPVTVYGRTVVIAQISEGASTPVRESGNAGRTWATWRIPFPTLVSVNGCSLTPTSARVLWASCPTGMQVSFFRSGDGGRTWSAVHQGQFSGTGGGFFAPASATVAYLDYGYPRHVLYAVRAAGLDPVRVGPLPCGGFTSEIFSDVSHGAGVCAASMHPSSPARLMVSSDHGHHWRRVEIP